MITRLWAALFGPSRLRLGMDKFEVDEGSVKVEGLTIAGPGQAVQDLILVITSLPEHEIKWEKAS